MPVPGALDTVLAAWRLRVPEFDVDACVAFRTARLTRTAATRPTGDLNSDDEFTDTQVPAIALLVGDNDSLFFEFGSTGITADDGAPLSVRSSGVEQNALPIGSQVRDRVLSDIRPVVARAIDRQWGSNTSWMESLRAHRKFSIQRGTRRRQLGTWETVETIALSW